MVDVPVTVYALTFKAQEARSDDGTIVTGDGTVFVLVKDDWVNGTATPYYGESMPKEALTFPTEVEAMAFAHAWKFHPWDAKPRRGGWRVVPVTAITETVVTGYLEES